MQQAQEQATAFTADNLAAEKWLAVLCAIPAHACPDLLAQAHRAAVCCAVEVVALIDGTGDGRLADQWTLADARVQEIEAEFGMRGLLPPPRLPGLCESDAGGIAAWGITMTNDDDSVSRAALTITPHLDAGEAERRAFADNLAVLRTPEGAAKWLADNPGGDLIELLGVWSLMAGEQPRALTLEAIDRDPWNAVWLPIPDDADRALLEGIEAAADSLLPYEGWHEVPEAEGYDVSLAHDRWQDVRARLEAMPRGPDDPTPGTQKGPDHTRPGSDHLADRIVALTFPGNQAVVATQADDRQHQAAGLALVAALGAEERGQHEDAAALRKEAAARQEIAAGSRSSAASSPAAATEQAADPWTKARDGDHADGQTAQQVQTIQKDSDMSGTNAHIFHDEDRKDNTLASVPAFLTATNTEVVSDPAFRVEVRPVVYPTPGATVMGLEQAHSDRTVETDYRGPTRNGDPATRIEMEPTAEAAAVPTPAPTILDEANRDHTKSGGNDYAILRAETPAPTIKHDEGPTPDELWTAAANEAGAAQNAREQSAERSEGDTTQINGNDARPQTYSERLAARFAAIKAEAEGLEQDHGIDRDAGPEGAAAAFRSFGR